jgi:hypothetical protein
VLKNLLLICLIIVTLSPGAETRPLPDTGISVNVLWPFYPGGSYRVRFRQALNSSSEYRTEGHLGLSVGTPKDRDVEGRFSERSVLIGGRQYIGSPFHFEFTVGLGKGKLENAVKTGKTYESDDVDVHLNFGYEWMLASSWSLDIQAGAGKVVSKSNPWPIYKDSTLTEEVGEQVFPTGSIHLVYWF